eukprot:g13133.t1
MPLKVWNEDLRRALVARQRKYAAESHQMMHTYRAAVVLLESQRKDIKQRRDGYIQNLPNFSSAQIKQLCERIIQGQDEAITPELVQYDPAADLADGFEHADVVAQMQLEDIENFVSTQMKFRKGSYAILMTLHEVLATTTGAARGYLVREDFENKAHRWMDGHFMPSFHNGALRGVGWESRETLKQRQYIVENKVGMGQKYQYSLTERGRKVVAEIIKHYHHGRDPVTQERQPSFGNAGGGGALGGFAAAAAPAAAEDVMAMPSTIADATSPEQRNVENWLRERLQRRDFQTTLTLDLSKEKRYAVHRFIDNRLQAHYRCFVEHPSCGTGKARKIVLTVKRGPQISGGADVSSSFGASSAGCAAASGNAHRADSESDDGAPALGSRVLASAAPSGGGQLTLVIDERERVNDTVPRELRNRIKAHTSRVASQYVACEIETVPISDFVWKNAATGSVFNVLIERKAVKDIVGRSVKDDQTRQLERMACVNATGTSVLIVDGELCHARNTIAYDSAGKDSVWNPRARYFGEFGEGLQGRPLTTAIRDHAEMLVYFAAVLTNGKIRVSLADQVTLEQVLSGYSLALAGAIGGAEAYAAARSLGATAPLSRAKQLFTDMQDFQTASAAVRAKQQPLNPKWNAEDLRRRKCAHNTAVATGSHILSGSVTLTATSKGGSSTRSGAPVEPEVARGRAELEVHFAASAAFWEMYKDGIKDELKAAALQGGAEHTITRFGRNGRSIEAEGPSGKWMPMTNLESGATSTWKQLPEQKAALAHIHDRRVCLQSVRNSKPARVEAASLSAASAKVLGMWVKGEELLCFLRQEYNDAALGPPVAAADTRSPTAVTVFLAAVAAKFVKYSYGKTEREHHVRRVLYITNLDDGRAKYARKYAGQPPCAWEGDELLSIFVAILTIQFEVTCLNFGKFGAAHASKLTQYLGYELAKQLANGEPSVAAYLYNLLFGISIVAAADQVSLPFASDKEYSRSKMTNIGAAAPVKRLRPYQLRLVEEIGDNNAIAKMPTGAGKTLLAAECIRRRLAESAPPSQEAGHKLKRKALFLVPTCDLVSQQAKAVREWCETFVVAEFMGGAAPPAHADAYDILVATPDAFRRLQMRNDAFHWREFKICVFDEVHHVLKDHPYRKLALSLRHLQQPQQVQILGLSASLTYAVGEAAIQETLRNLTRDLNLQKMLSVSDAELRAGGYDPPHGEIELAHPRVIPEGLVGETDRKPHLLHSTFFARVKRGEATPLARMVLSVVREMEAVAGQCDLVAGGFKSPLAQSRLAAWEEYAHKLGKRVSTPCGGSFLQKLEVWYVALRLLVQTWEEEEQLVLNWLSLENAFTLECLVPHDASLASARSSTLTSSWKNLAGLLQEVRRLAENPSNLSKLACLKAQLLEKMGTFGREHFRGIVFVEQRITAHILSRSIALDRDLTAAGFCPDYITARGANITPSVAVSNQQASECVKKFRSGEVNLIIATSVIEEGFDVPAANVVISFDHLKNSVELAQRFGRARQTDRRVVVMDQRADRPLSRLEEVRDEQDALISDFAAGSGTGQPSAKEIAAEKSAQLSRERGAAAYLNEVPGKLAGEDVQRLNMFAKKTKAHLAEDCRKAAGDWCFVWTYSSVLRELRSEARGQTKQAAKREAAGTLLGNLRAQIVVDMFGMKITTS